MGIRGFVARHTNVAIHAALVVGLAVGYAILVVSAANDPDTPDANIGAGIVFLPLAGLGLPWSLVVFTGAIETSRDYGWDWLEFAVVVACASVNVAIHLLLSRRADGRATREGAA